MPMGAPTALGLRVHVSTPWATPEAGYSSLREKPASGATGSAKVSATASHSSGDFMLPRPFAVLSRMITCRNPRKLSPADVPKLLADQFALADILLSREKGATPP